MGYIAGYLSFGIILTYLSTPAIHETVREHHYGKSAEIVAYCFLSLFYPVIMIISVFRKMRG